MTTQYRPGLAPVTTAAASSAWRAANGAPDPTRVPAPRPGLRRWGVGVALAGGVLLVVDGLLAIAWGMAL